MTFDILQMQQLSKRHCAHNQCIPLSFFEGQMFFSFKNTIYLDGLSKELKAVCYQIP